LPLVRTLYAITYPWGLPYRLFLVVAVVVALVAAVGGLQIGRWIEARRFDHRLSARAWRVGVVAWLIVAPWALGVFVSIPAQEVSSFAPDDDGAAMAWLRANVAPGEVVANDTFADAGIWAPYKAGVDILLYRTASAEDTAAANLIIDNIGHLDTVPAARDEACRRNVRYVYYGAKNTDWQARAFPPLSELQAAPSLETVFSSGEATVFRLRLTCPPPS
jgi:hypothetical protein